MCPLATTNTETSVAHLERRPRAVLIAAILALGCWLRLDQWLDQVLIDDEWHVLHQIIDHGPGDLFLTFGYADYSIPFGLLNAWLANAVGLSEWMMRFPFLLAGMATLVAFPHYVARRLGGSVAAVFAFLLAISPILIFYSRIARPYAFTLLLGWTAHAAAQRFFVSRSLGAAAVYVICAVLTTWAHPIIAPFVLAPLLWVVLAPPGGQGWPARRKALWDAMLLGVPTAFLLVALLARH